MPNKRIDDAKVRQLVAQGIDVPNIAKRLGVQRPCIYRALRRNGIQTAQMKRYGDGPDSNYPPTPKKRSPFIVGYKDFGAEEREIAARRILPRDPCFRCGARGDVDCGCSKAPVGWRIG